MHAPSATHPGAASVYAFGKFKLDVPARVLWRDGVEPVQLPSRAFDSLVYLVEHRDRLVQKNELIDAVWPDVVVTDDSLIHAISVLRRALADDPDFRARFLAEPLREGSGSLARPLRPGCHRRSDSRKRKGARGRVSHPARHDTPMLGIGGLGLATPETPPGTPVCADPRGAQQHRIAARMGVRRDGEKKGALLFRAYRIVIMLLHSVCYKAGEKRPRCRGRYGAEGVGVYARDSNNRVAT